MALTIDKRINNTLILSLGGNVGDVKEVFSDAISEIEAKVGVVISQSSIYSTAAWGVESQPDFLNQVLEVETSLFPTDCLTLVLAIEKELGRVRDGKKWHERIIDIDILFYNNEMIDLPDLKVPHPYIQERNFILIPLSEILPNYIHPQFKKSVFDLRNECSDKLEVTKVV